MIMYKRACSKRLFLLGMTVLVIGVGCTSVPSPTPAPNATIQPYPVENVSPVVAYPVSSTPIPNAVQFEFDRPVKGGATIITGNAPKGVVINIANATLMGDPLGSAVVGDDNRFSVNVSPLLANIRIGIEVADAGSSGYLIEDFYNSAFWGPEWKNLPQVGYYLDTTLVEP
jgi:hypothetical protein